MGAREECESKGDPGRRGCGEAPVASQEHAAAVVCVEGVVKNRALMGASPRSANLYPTPSTGSTGS